MMTKSNHNLNHLRHGMALITVLFVIMTVTVLSLGFLAKSDTELACGRNMLLREQIDALALSGLEHAKGCILFPQELPLEESQEFWPGASAQQITSPGSDYYDVSVAKLNASVLDYNVVSTAYRKKGSELVGTSSFVSKLRLDPYVGLWLGSACTIPACMTVNTDIFCANSVTLKGKIFGDCFMLSPKTLVLSGGSRSGQTKSVGMPPIYWPNCSSAAFASQYYIVNDSYAVNKITVASLHDVALEESAANPKGVCYRAGDLELGGSVFISGLLAVNGDLSVSGTNHITAVRNYPALIVNGRIIFKNNARLVVDGLAQAGGNIEWAIDANGVPASNVSFTVNGALYLNQGFALIPLASTGNSVVINPASPRDVVTEFWDSPGSVTRWRPMQAVFKNLVRKM